MGISAAGNPLYDQEKKNRSEESAGPWISRTAGGSEHGELGNEKRKKKIRCGIGSSPYFGGSSVSPPIWQVVISSRARKEAAAFRKLE